MKTLAAYKAHLREIGKLNSALALLQWDQRTCLPPKGHEARAETIGKLAKIVFELGTADKLGRYLEKLEVEDSLSLEDRASVRVVGKDYRRHKAIPPSLFERFAVARSRSESAWEKARAASDFESFQPHLEEMVDFARRFAEYYGYKENPYDALIEGFEPGMTGREVRGVMAPLRERLVPFLKRLLAEGARPDTSFLRGSFSADRQRALSLRALEAMGYDFAAGRLDTAVHPFTSSTGPNDVRVTTRFVENDLLSSLYSSLHEGGHALYDQGISPELQWTGLDEGASFGIHESQSRLWENMIGRSLPFWTFFRPILTQVFPELSSPSADALWRAVNVVEPRLIRVEADEVTYNLHIMLRFELEDGLINGKIVVADLPDLWRDAMGRYLGVTPTDDASGVLQDVHWSAGLFGYFPSYMLGNLYAAQVFATLQEETPDLDARIARGDFALLRGWLQDRVHRFGKVYEPKELVKRVTGKEPDSAYFLSYITRKYSEVYRLAERG